jgi:hypothetical protein
MVEDKKVFPHSGYLPDENLPRDFYAGILTSRGRLGGSAELGKKNSKRTDTLQQIPLGRFQ